MNTRLLRGSRAGYLLPGAFAFAFLLCLPVVTLLILALQGDTHSLQRVFFNVLPGAGATTVLLLIGVGLVVSIVGTFSAWLVTFFDFPFRAQLQWALVLPIAVPTYISAYAFVEFFSFTGPLQEVTRFLGGYQSSREYAFPEIRSLWGTIFVFGFVLYPYVYLSVRALFRFQGSSYRDSAKVLGTRGWRLFRNITLPMVRPAIVLGVVLALMETINDIGAVEYLGTKTLTVSVFSVWLNQGDLSGASQIAIFLLLIVALLIAFERLSRGSRQYFENRASDANRIYPERLVGKFGILATIVAILPVLIGFGIPVFVLLGFAVSDLDQLFSTQIGEALLTSMFLAAIAALVAVGGGLLLGYGMRTNEDRTLKATVRFASIGYAVPGTLIAIGTLIPLAYFDNSLDAFLRQYAGYSTGLLLTGSAIALVFAYVVRFMAMAIGNLENGFSKIPLNLDMAGRSLGRSRYQVLREILMPLLKPAIFGAALLVFVEVVKELSATILLRPFGMNTLATHVYDYASQGRVEDAALGCLLIVLIGILPVILLTRVLKL